MGADIVDIANVLSTQTAAAAAIAPDAQAKQVLKEAVDAVVNSFAKHTQGYGRGEFFCRSFFFTLSTFFTSRFFTWSVLPFPLPAANKNK